MPPETWIIEHRDRQSRLYAALDLGIISSDLAEILDAADNRAQALLVAIARGEKNN